MDTVTHDIEVIYESSCATWGIGTLDWLQQSGVAEKDREPDVTASGCVRQHLITRQNIAMDSVIVFVSDVATANRDWHNFIDASTQNVRFIPVDCGIETVNFNDPEVMPPVLEEINFIRIDDKLYLNILDSLTTDPQFYTIKNHLMLRYKSWAIAGYEGDLLTNRKDIKQYREAFETNLAGQRDEYLRAQIQGILDYLEASDRYAKKLTRQKVLRWIGRGILVALAVTVLLLIRWLGVYFNRASYATLALSVDSESADPISGAIKMTEAITNPFSTEMAKKIAYEKYVAFMDKVWDQSPIGQNYKYTINDAAIPAGSRYIWTADSGGKALLWDTYTGQIESKQKLADGDLFCIAVNSLGNVVAMDSNGKIYRGDGKGWQDTGGVSSVNPAAARLKMSDSTVLIYDRNTVEQYDAQTATLLQNTNSTITVLDAGITAEGKILVAASDNGSLLLGIWSEDGILNYISTGITVNNRSVTDIRGDTLIVTDNTGQVWKVTGTLSERIPLVLPQTLALRFVNDYTVVYHERNIGTGLYDIDEFFDYGSVLSDFRALNKIYATEDMLLMMSESDCRPVSLEGILKKNNASSETVYDSKNAAADLSVTSGKGVESIEIADNGVIAMKLQLANGPVTAMLDPAMILHNNSGHYAQEDVAVLPDDYLYYEDEPFMTYGLPMVAGIRFVAANELNNTDYYYILVGCSDGSFFELALDIEKGTITKTCEHVIPSRTAITAIYQTKDGYMLKDKAGRFWECRTGINTISEKGIYESVKTKLHSGVTVQVKDLVSSEVWNTLGLTVYPGGDGEEWE